MVAIKQQLSFLHSLNIVLRRIVSSTPIIEIRSRFIRIHILQQSTVWLICSEQWCSCSHSISVSSKRISLFVKLRFRSYASSLQHPNTNQITANYKTSCPRARSEWPHLPNPWPWPSARVMTVKRELWSWCTHKQKFRVSGHSVQKIECGNKRTDIRRRLQDLRHGHGQ